jgi:hypothetical protein
MIEREQEAGVDRTLAVLHELAHGIVDRSDMVCVDGLVRPCPGGNVGGDQKRLERRRPAVR